ncbi:DUF3515 family protein [Streptomyces sp. NPDC026659]|uniref:DUF3515 family protein n=1 Tax=Streptomyces sp. NPDC026659 TaxID=3155123 RepID=UPI0033EA6E6D
MKTTSGRRPARSGAIAVCAATLAACGMTSRSYSVSAVPGGESAACTTVVNNSPHELGGRERTESDVKGTAVWGDGDVILRCGRISNVPEPAPCSSVNGVDWVVNAANTHDGTKTVLTYGRTPAAEITLSERIKNKDAVIGEMSGIVAGLPEQKTCARRG